MERRMHSCRNAPGEASLPRQKPYRPVHDYHASFGKPAPGGCWKGIQQKRRGLVISRTSRRWYLYRHWNSWSHYHRASHIRFHRFSRVLKRKVCSPSRPWTRGQTDKRKWSISLRRCFNLTHTRGLLLQMPCPIHILWTFTIQKMSLRLVKKLTCHMMKWNFRRRSGRR